ncbi:hypothetical protein RRSWK_05913 [Rhodopirellula sp. SWK7]|nr:hypothetical protein RRSWK_05913 [Rhodopirellula sp. SWK7]
MINSDWDPFDRFNPNDPIDIPSTGDDRQMNFQNIKNKKYRRPNRLIVKVKYAGETFVTHSPWLSQRGL